MAKNPERLSAANSPEHQQNKLSSVFSFAKRLKNSPNEIMQWFGRQSSSDKAIIGFGSISVVDLTQVLVNRILLNYNPIVAVWELISDISIISAADNLASKNKIVKGLAVAQGMGGVLATTSIKVGNPDLYLPGLMIGGVTTGATLLSYFVKNNKPSLNEPIFKSGTDIWVQWAKSDQERN